MMDFIDEHPLIFVAACILVVLACLVGLSKMESDTYNRVTGAHTTWWDAVWIELRVQDNPK